MKSNRIKQTPKALISLGMGLLMTLSLPALAGTKAQYCPVKPLSATERVRADGVQVIHLGETVKLVIPSHRLFYPGTAKFAEGSHSLLKDVKHLLNTYHIISIEVAAYSDNVHPGVFKKAVTISQAEAVQSFLSDHGLTARLIYANGQGDKNPVASNRSEGGRAANRRIEIGFQYIPKTTIYETVVVK